MLALSKIANIFSRNKFDRKAYDYVAKLNTLDNMKALLNGIRNSKEMDNLQKAVYILVKIIYELREMTESKNAIMDNMRAINDAIKIERDGAQVMDVSQTLDGLLKILISVPDNIKNNLEKIAKDFGAPSEIPQLFNDVLKPLFDEAKKNGQNMPHNSSHIPPNRKPPEPPRRPNVINSPSAAPTALGSRPQNTVQSPSAAPTVLGSRPQNTVQSPSAAPTALGSRPQNIVRSPSNAPRSTSSFVKGLKRHLPNVTSRIGVHRNSLSQNEATNPARSRANSMPPSPSAVTNSVRGRANSMPSSPSAVTNPVRARTNSMSSSPSAVTNSVRGRANSMPSSPSAPKKEFDVNNIYFPGSYQYRSNKGGTSKDIYEWLDTFLGVAQMKLAAKDDDMKYLAEKNREKFGESAWRYGGILVDIDKQKTFFSDLNNQLLDSYSRYRQKKDQQTLTLDDSVAHWGVVESIVKALDNSVFMNIPDINSNVKGMKFDLLKNAVGQRVKEPVWRRNVRNLSAVRLETKNRNSGLSAGDKPSSVLSETQKQIISKYVGKVQPYIKAANDMIEAVQMWVTLTDNVGATKKVMSQTDSYLQEVEKLSKGDISLLKCKSLLNRALDTQFVGLSANVRSLGRFPLAFSLAFQKVTRIPLICEDIIKHLDNIQKQAKTLANQAITKDSDKAIYIDNYQLVIKKDALSQNNLKSKLITFYSAVETDMNRTVGQFKDQDIDKFFKLCQKVEMAKDDVKENMRGFEELVSNVKTKVKSYLDQSSKLADAVNSASPFGGGGAEPDPAVTEMNKFVEFLDQKIR